MEKSENQTSNKHVHIDDDDFKLINGITRCKTNTTDEGFLRAIVRQNHQELCESIGPVYESIITDTNAGLISDKEFLKLQLSIKLVQFVGKKLKNDNWTLITSKNDHVNIIVDGDAYDITKSNINSINDAMDMFEHKNTCCICLNNNHSFNLCETCNIRVCKRCFIYDVENNHDEQNNYEKKTILCHGCRTPIINYEGDAHYVLVACSNHFDDLTREIKNALKKKNLYAK